MFQAAGDLQVNNQDFFWAICHRQATLCVRLHIFVMLVDHGQFLLWERNFPQINQTTFKLPYIGRSIKYYTVAVVSCIVLGNLGGFWTIIIDKVGNFSQWSPAGQFQRHGSQVVWAHLCRKSQHSVDSNLWEDPSQKPCFVWIQVSNYDWYTGHASFQSHLVLLTIFALPSPPLTVDFHCQTIYNSNIYSSNQGKSTVTGGDGNAKTAKMTEWDWKEAQPVYW